VVHDRLGEVGGLEGALHQLATVPPLVNLDERDHPVPQPVWVRRAGSQLPGRDSPDEHVERQPGVVGGQLQVDPVVGGQGCERAENHDLLIDRS
jgi:hypothetical protein